MKSPTILLLALLSFSLSCSHRDTARFQAGEVKPVAQNARLEAEQTTPAQSVAQLKVSLTDADRASATAEAFDRKIIRNAEVTIEVASTTDTQYQVASIAEANGG